MPPHLPEHDLFALIGDQQDLTVTTAESCTGGHIGARIVNVPGSSAYFRGGVMSYANDIKMQVLGVRKDTLDTVGAVSEACACEMAAGARRLMSASFAVSTTGIAGPTGGTARKPVGLVYIGCATPDGVFAEEHVFPGDRADVIAASAERALQLLVDQVRSYLENTRASGTD